MKRSLLALLAIALCASAGSVTAKPGHDFKNVVVLGVDGMDPKLLQKFIAQGIMPNFEALMDEGSFSTLRTSVPPQSPVAWSNFITGMNPGGHGIFDFIHRDESSYLPTFSTALVAEAEKTIKIGKYVIPLSKGRVELLRGGEAFWQVLDHCEVPYTVFRIPANFPPVESKGTNVAGMGTPDLLGTYGTFSFFTDDPSYASLDVSGGEIFTVRVNDDRVEAEMLGPENSMLEDKPDMTSPFVVHIDREYGTARINVGDEVVILQVGEFSEWVPVEFDVMPFNKLSGITRFYLKGIDPYFQLYATPININPGAPALPISEPAGFAKQLYEKIGHYYTQGMPEDTKAFEWGIFTDAEFVQQSEIVFQERLAMLDAVLDDYKDGFLFFYFSSIDQTCHMLWRNMDPNHPGHTEENAKYGDRIEHLYARMDSVLGTVRERIPEDATLIVMSDHGFAPYYKKVNLNTWLYENDFMTLRKPKEVGRYPLFRNVFWRRTQAYGLGINGLYVNMRGRESQGIVRPEDYDALLEEISAKLLEYRDPETGAQVVKRVYRADEIYSGDDLEKAPDIIVGYTAGYRGSDDSALGNLSKEVISLNMDKWSGDHCMAYEEVPGIFVSNRSLVIDDPNLTDMAVTILRLYGMEPPENMVGRSVFDNGKLSSR